MAKVIGGNEAIAYAALKGKIMQHIGEALIDPANESNLTVACSAAVERGIGEAIDEYNIKISLGGRR